MIVGTVEQVVELNFVEWWSKGVLDVVGREEDLAFGSSMKWGRTWRVAGEVNCEVSMKQWGCCD